MGTGSVQCSPRKVGPGCPVSSRSQVSSELCYPHPALFVRIPRSLLWEGRLPPTHEPYYAHPVTFAGGQRASSRSPPLQQPEVTFTKLFLRREPAPKVKAVQTVFICPKHEGEMVTKREVFCRRGSEQDSSFGQIPGTRPSPQWGVKEETGGWWRGPRAGAAEGVQADRAVTKDSCKSSTKAL